MNENEWCSFAGGDAVNSNVKIGMYIVLRSNRAAVGVAL